MRATVVLPVVLVACGGGAGQGAVRGPTPAGARALGPAPAVIEGDLGLRCAALGPRQPPPPPAAVCRAAVPPTPGFRMERVPGGRWLDPAPRPVSPAPAPRRPPPHQRFVPPRLEIRPRLAGCLDTSIFRRKFLEQRRALRCCLLASPLRQPETQIRIRFAMGCEGRPTEVRIQAEPALAPQVARCLAQVISSWQFPATRPGERIQVVYPLRYLPAAFALSPDWSAATAPGEP